jgi:uncharacterized membrane protein
MDTQQTPQQQTPHQQPFKFEPNIAAVISYIPFIGSIYFLMSEKENKFIRFHAMQSLIFWLVFLGVSGIMSTLKLLYIGVLLEPIFQVGTIALWFFLMYQAYMNVEYELPILGKIAKDQVQK